MKARFKHINTIIGWLMFLIAAIVYIKTTEATAPLWDCTEYTATAVKLEVGHAPGAPLYQMMGAVITNMFDVEPSDIAFMMNVFACLASAVSIMLLFWIITFFARRIESKKWEEVSTGTAVAIFGSGIVGSAAILFSDTFWFNATESEVYSLANLFTVLVFYLGVRWVNGFGKEYNNKWLLMIALMIGLAPGVHFMGMLGIPVIAMMYYYEVEDKKVTTKRFILANIVACGVLLLTFGVIFPFLINSFGAVDVFFVNSLGAPFHYGTIFWAVFLVAIFILLLWISTKKGWIATNTIVLMFMFIVIGFSCYLMIPIRANANTPINENEPTTAEGLNYYFTREQYGKQSRIYGPSYNARPDMSNPYIIGKPIYSRNDETGKYEETDRALDIRYLPEYMNFFPRISNDQGYDKGYMELTGLKKDEAPTFGDNLYFFLTYQLGYMNMRYFLWNFSGRQNDFQGHSDIHKGNWITGITFLDEARLGPQDPQADYLKNNAAHNVYYMLPLILGLVGLYFHFRRHEKDAYCVFLFFLITGVGITFYSNNPPYEPRERDYALVVSFWTFGIWIGLGVLALYTWLKKYIKKSPHWLIAAVISIIAFLAVPTLMAAQNWDDHDRSTRSTARAVGRNYLSSVGENGILVTYGDNDTFPLWYMQEMENYRTDIRVVNASLLMCDWYINQLRSNFYDGKALPLTLKQKAYTGKTNETVYLNEESGLADKELDIKTFMTLIAAEHPVLMQKNLFGQYDYMIPTRYISIPVNKENAVKYGIVSPENAPFMEDTLHITIGRERGKNVSIDKKTLAFLDFLSSYNWDRPIHFGLGAEGSPDENMFALKDYVIAEGLTYKLIPFKLSNLSANDGDNSYNIITKNWEYGGMEIPTTYLTEADKRSALHMRLAMLRATKSLLMDEDTTRAREIINLSLEKMPLTIFYVDDYSLETINTVYMTGQKEKADTLAMYAFDQLEKDFMYFSSFPNSKKMRVWLNAYRAIYLYQSLLETIEPYNPTLAKKKNEYSEKMKQAYTALFVNRK